jgi:NAD(P)-dependent dehydrogenase (short-subunit alcohol dehydrogenase family)
LIDIAVGRFENTVQVNLHGPLTWIQQAWRHSMAERGGSVINISSVAALKYGGPLGMYNLTKAALVYMTKHLAQELGPAVRVNAIAPGLVKTDFARALWGPEGEDAIRSWPLQRLGQPVDIANTALFLASDLSSWITGDLFTVDGGAALQ